MSRSSRITMVALALLLFFMTEAARPAPTDSREIPQPQIGVEEQSDASAEDCGEDCLMRRTLAAHIDYIYTQQKKH